MCNVLVFHNVYSNVHGPPLPNRPFITVWNTPTSNCKYRWNVTLNLSAFDFVVNREQLWLGEYIAIFYSNQIGLYPYFDENGTAVNGGLPQVLEQNPWLNFRTAPYFINYVCGSMYVVLCFATKKQPKKAHSPTTVALFLPLFSFKNDLHA